MKSVIRKGWRDSASLIVLNKRHSDITGNCERSAVNYDVLLQTRPKTASFPNSVVFPGGVIEPADESDQWLNLFNSFGFDDKDYTALYRPGTPTLPIFQPSPIKRQIALRITAVRETFEELGLLLCSNEHKKNRQDIWAHIITNIDLKFWQQRVAKDPSELLNLCKEHNCYPDIWSLHYWSNWLTPKYQPRRFSTAFFVAALKTRHAEIKSDKEVVKVQWSTPLEILERNINKELQLYPPQSYELLRLLHIPDIEDLIKFAQERSGYCNELIYPVIATAKDGLFWVYPGDDLYPAKVDFYQDELQFPHKTVLELREESKVVHRLELFDREDKKWIFVTKNYKENNHIDMGDQMFQTYFSSLDL